MKKKGFTLVELLITITVFSIVIASVLTLFINSQKTKYRVDMMTEAQQSARTAIDYMIKDIRAAGYNIDLEENATSSPQRRIVYASPYELIFNANIRPVQDDPENPITPTALDPGSTPNPLHYTPSKMFETGAETIVYTLDYNNDGSVNGTDRVGTEAAFTPNPNDYALVKRVYGYDATNNTNGGVRQIVSMVGGPDRFPGQTEGVPLFSYWYDDDNDPTTDNKLWGDTDASGTLSLTEANSLTGIANPDILDKIRIITVNVTGIATSESRDDYIKTNIQTDVSVTRNASINVQTVVGHVYKDANIDSAYSTGEAGIPGVKVRLNTGEMTYTDSEGKWAFALITGSYSATCTPIVGYTPTSDLYFDFAIGDEDLDCTSEAEFKDYFGLRVTPTADIFGFAYIDVEGDSFWNAATDPLLGGIQISVWNNSTISLDDPSSPYYGYYNLTVNAEETLYAWVSPPEGYSCIKVDTVIMGMGTDSSDVMLFYEELSPLDFAIDMPDGSRKAIALGVVQATGLPPYVELLSPNGGEIWTIGEANDIRVKIVDPENEPIERILFYYSIDAGVTWKEIANVPFPTLLSDSTYNYSWIIDSLSGETGSTISKLKVGVIDAGNWTIYDESDYYFTLVGEEGYKFIYFTSETVDSTLDETVYLYSLGTDPSDVLPRYLDKINSYATSVVGDSFNFSGSVIGKPFWTQNTKYSHFITRPGIPYADTIYQGVWKFFLTGWTDDDEDQLKYFDIEVHKRDSTGDSLSDTLLFSTLTGYNVDSYNIIASPFSNAEEIDTLFVPVTSGFDLNRTDRLYIQLFWSGNSANTGGPSGDISAHIQFHYGGDANSRLILPPKP